MSNHNPTELANHDDIMNAAWTWRGLDRLDQIKYAVLEPAAELQ